MASFIYPIVVVVTVLLSSIALGYLLIKHNMLNLQVFLSITISTIAISIAFPQVCGIIIEVGSNLPFLTVLLPVAFILVYLSMVFLFTIIISMVISEKVAKELTNKIANNVLANSVKAIIEKVSSSRNNAQSAKNEYISAKQADGDTESKKIGQEIAEIIIEQNAVAEMEAATEPELTIDGEAEEELVQLGDESDGDDIQGKNILEKSVDSEENIDTMCIESIIEDTMNIVENSENFDIPVGVENGYEDGMRPDAFDFITNSEITTQEAEQTHTMEKDEVSEEEESVSVGPAEEEMEIAEQAAEEFVIEEAITDESPASHIEPETKGFEHFIDNAFRFKEQGNFEESIQNYMYALEQKPDKDLVFWIVLDMCVLYKNIGQAELAKDILESYITSYGDIMDEAVKSEIEKNL